LRNRAVPILFALAAAVVPAARATALVPEEVLVVANANAAGSVALAKYYALGRNILPERILVLRCTPDPEVARDEYNTRIRDPIREYLKRHDRAGKIKCLALVWGVPVRVQGAALTDELRKALKTLKTLRQRLHAREAVHLKLLASVGGTFPQPRTGKLTPLGKLFASGINASPEKMESHGKLVAAFDRRMRYKIGVVAGIADAAKRRIASAQLAALDLDARGITYLLKHLPEQPAPALPTKDQLQQRLRAAEAAMARHKAAPETAETARRMVDLVSKVKGARGAYAYCDKRIKAIEWVNKGDAAVDSELALCVPCT